MNDKPPLSTMSMLWFAFWALGAHFRTALRLCIPSAALVLIGAAVAVNLGAAPGAGGFMSPSAGMIMLGFGFFFAGALAMTPVVTGWHRILIVGSGDRGSGGIYGWDSREWSYLYRWILLMIMFVILALVASFILSSGLLIGSAGGGPESAVTVWALGILLSLIQAMIFALIMARFGLALPAAALGDNLGFGQASLLIDGRALPLTLALLIAAVATEILLLPIEYLFALDLGLPGWQTFGAFATVMIYFLLLLVSVGVLSAAYAALRPEPDAETA